MQLGKIYHICSLALFFVLSSAGLAKADCRVENCSIENLSRLLDVLESENTNEVQTALRTLVKCEAKTEHHIPRLIKLLRSEDAELAGNSAKLLCGPSIATKTAMESWNAIRKILKDRLNSSPPSVDWARKALFDCHVALGGELSEIPALPTAPPKSEKQIMDEFRRSAWECD